MPPGGSPAAKALSNPVKSGTVTVKEGGKVICVTTVVNGKGGAHQLKAGSRPLIASYGGDKSHHASSSTVKKIAITS
ncbi:MAG: hypothetical protein JWM19_2074 [Actinomycetia bacterium]|nr:hypothetical protein [Actinomycetes bacterium]